MHKKTKSLLKKQRKKSQTFNKAESVLAGLVSGDVEVRDLVTRHQRALFCGTLPSWNMKKIRLGFAVATRSIKSVRNITQCGHD
ncbi:hypothetical protein J4727_07425 [Providencia rettgeri]|uniref:Uncharacterized protein n=1 Tax=Providencia rettgeri TaxID=587 RepID=A0A939NC45_PRORE|nr:hypothetical protein [Providencia rettgeri]